MKLTSLTPEQRLNVEEALLGAYNYQSFTRMLRLHLGVKLSHEVNTQSGFKYVVSNLVEIALEGGWLADLLLAAHQYNDGNWRLSRTVTELGVTPPTLRASAVDDATLSLEKIVDDRLPQVDFATFMARMERLSPRICRIECPENTPQGTGWLVGPDLLLTAYHVVESVHQNDLPASEVVFRFNYLKRDSAVDERDETCCGLARADWLLDHATYSQADLAPDRGDPSDDELDYALLRLDQRVGEDVMPSGAPRGWIEVPQNPTVVRTDDFMLVAQHPGGDPLNLAFGGVLGYNAPGNRLRHKASTAPGSSGAPCFSFSMEPFGIHQAAGPADDLPYNQCIPLRAVVHRLSQGGIQDLWTGRETTTNRTDASSSI